VKIDLCSDLHVDAWLHATQIRDPKARMWTGEPYKSTFLHLDWRFCKNPDSQVLIIAGDISNDLKTSVEVISHAASEYRWVVVADGNHDHYANDEIAVHDAMDMFKNMLAPMANVVFLDSKSKLVIDDVAFIGGAGWYDFKAYVDHGISEEAARKTWKAYSDDANYPIFENGDPAYLAKQQAQNLTQQIIELSEDDQVNHVVVTTHMSPKADLMEWKHHDPVWNLLTPSYVNTQMSEVLDADTKGKIGHWIYGHTHRRQIKNIGNVQYINNARGYPRENPPFSLIQIEVPAKKGQ
jgi:DNA repair exonuclease SbcCD nuclease subunit